MDNQFNTAAVNKYNAELQFLTREEGSKTGPIFPVVSSKAEIEFHDQIGKGSGGIVKDRYQILDVTEQTMRRVATKQVRHFERYLFDPLDTNIMAVPVQQASMKNLMQTHGEVYDKVAFAALLGDVDTGKAGTGGPDVFDTDYVIAHGSTGLTLAKFNQAIRILQTGELDTDNEELVLFHDAHGAEDLYAEPNLVTIDSVDHKILGRKNIPMIRNIQLIQTQRLPIVGATEHRAILCTKKALIVSMAENFNIKVGNRTDLPDVPQFTAYATYGMVRRLQTETVDIRVDIS